MSDNFDTGVNEQQAAAADTGVKESQAAAETGLEEESFDENTLFEQESEEPEEITLEDLYAEDEPEKVETSGDDNPPENQEADKSEEQSAETALPQQQADIANSKAFALRLQQEKQKIEARIRKEYEAKNAESLEDRITGRAHQLMHDFPEDIKSLDYAKRQAKREIESEMSIAPETPSEPADDAETKKQAWLNSLTTEEPLLKIATGDPNITWESYAKKDPIFKKALSMGRGPLEAHEITKAARAVLKAEVEAAKAAGGQEVLNRLKDSNSQATAPIKPAKSGKKSKGIEDMTADEIEQAVNDAERRGKKLLIG